MNILVVDDEIEMAHMLKTAIEMRYSSNVFLAHSGRDGLSRVQSQGADLIVSDLMMPDMNGLEMLRNIKAQDKNIPVVFITAHADIESTMEAIRLGAADFIRKPFTSGSLYHSLDRLIHLKSEIDVFTQPLAFTGTTRWEFTTKDIHITEFSGNLTNLLAKGHLIPYHERHPFYVVLSEALTNAREHGNLNLHSHLKDEDMTAYETALKQQLNIPELARRKIHIELAKTDMGIAITITDEGPGFDHRFIDSKDFSQPENLMKLHGKGLLIIKAYMDGVIFNERGNSITIIKDTVANQEKQV